MDGLKAILACYPDIGPGYSVRAGPRGFSAAAGWLVADSRGRYFVKRLSPACSLSRVRFIAESQAHICSSMGGAPALRRAADNQDFLVHETGYYMVSTYVEGAVRPVAAFTPQMCAAAGEFLGRVHAAFAGFTGYLGQDSLMAFCADPHRRLADLLAEHREQTRDTFAIEALEYKRSRLRQLEGSWLDRVADLPRQIIHGDVYAQNLLFNQQNQIVALVDFDRSCRYFRAYELMRAMLLLTYASPGMSPADPALLAFVSGYFRRVRLTPSELECLVDLYYWTQLGDLYCFRPADALALGAAEARAFARARMAIIRWLGRHRQELCERINAAHAAAER